MTASTTDGYRYAPLQHSQASPSASLLHRMHLDRVSLPSILLTLLATAILLYIFAPHLPLLSSLTPLSLPPLVVRHSQLSDAATSHPSASLSKRVHLPPSQLPNVQQFAVATFAPHSSTERHVHPSLSEIFHVKHGQAKFVFDGERDEVVGVDDTVAIPPGTWHMVVNDGDVELQMVYVSVLV